MPTFNAASPERDDVQAAIDLASDGDIVVVPAGTATWSTGVNVPVNILLQGGGINTTILIDELTSRLVPMFDLDTNDGGLPFRMTGISFQGGTVNVAQNFGGVVVASGNCKLFRIDRCSFNALHAVGIGFLGDIWGVIDHCWFSGLDGHPVTVQHTTWDGVGAFGDNSWADDPFWGTEKFIFIEDCVCDASLTPAGLPKPAGDGFDAFGGGRYVVRHCILTDMRVQNHGTEGGRRRGARLIECYENEMTITATCTNKTEGQLRGGTMLFWGNTMTGYVNGKTLQNYRDFTSAAFYGPVDGENVFDDNVPNPAGGVDYYATGTHTGADGAADLEDTNAAKTWWDNAGAPQVGAWPTDRWLEPGVMYMIRNITQEIPGDTGANTPRSLENDANTITCSVQSRNGRHLTFDNGDTYEIWKVTQRLDQPAAGKGDLYAGGAPVNLNQILEPCYSWDLTGDTPFGFDHAAGQAFEEGVDYFNATPKPGYTPYTYPHPLTGDPPEAGSIIELSMPGGGDFGDVTIGETLSRDLQVHNAGDVLFTVSAITPPTGWTQTGGPSAPFDVDPDETLPLLFTFEPLLEQVYGGDITLTTDADSGTETFAVTGRGVTEAGGGIIRITMPEGPNWGDVPIGEEVPRALNVENRGDTTFTVSDITVPEGWSQTNGAIPPFTIAPGITVGLTFTFAPLEDRNYEGDLVFDTDATSGSETVTFRGRGQASGVGGILEITIPQGPDWGDVPIGTTVSRAINVRDLGDEDILVSGITIPSGWSQVGGATPPFTIPAGVTVGLTFGFTPLVAQNYLGDLIFDTDADSGSETVTLSGRGVHVSDGTVTVLQAKYWRVSEEGRDPEESELLDYADLDSAAQPIAYFNPNVVGSQQLTANAVSRKMAAIGGPGRLLQYVFPSIFIAPHQARFSVLFATVDAPGVKANDYVIMGELLDIDGIYLGASVDAILNMIFFGVAQTDKVRLYLWSGIGGGIPGSTVIPKSARLNFRVFSNP